MSELNGMCKQFCTEKVTKILQEQLPMLESFCAKKRTDALKDAAWTRECARLEFKLLSIKLRNVMLDLENARLEKDTSAMVENKCCKGGSPMMPTRGKTPGDDPVTRECLLRSISEDDSNSIGYR